MFILVVFSVSALKVQGAEIYFGANNKELGLNEKLEIGVFLDTKGQSINAIEGEILFPSDLLDFKGIINGGSVVSLWVKNPYLSSDGKVSFSGVTPGGVNTPKAYLFSLLFSAKKTGKATLSTDNEKILLNDGTGSKTSVTKAPLILNISEKKSEAPEFVPLYDNNPPDLFQLQVAKDENLFSGKWFLVFNTQDKESGVSYYEILEKPQLNSIFSLPFLTKEQWVKGESPYLLKDQTLRSVILVKAFDRAGNTTIASLTAQNKVRWYESFWLFGIIIITPIIAVVIFVLRKISWKN